MKTIKASKENFKETTAALKNGAVLVLPTDTVYGLVCDAANEKAVEKIFEIKKRDKQKPLAVFVKDLEMAKKYAVITKDQKELLNKSWPGAVTFVLEAKSGLASLVYKNKTIAMRIPDFGLIRKIFKEFENPLAQTSANISARPATIKIKKVLEQFRSEDVLIVDADDLPKNKPSVIIDLTKNKINIIRP